MTKMPLTELQVSSGAASRVDLVVSATFAERRLFSETQRDGVSGLPGVLPQPLLLLLPDPERGAAPPHRHTTATC